MEKDVLRRFLFEDFGIRGEWVNLTQSWQTIKQHHVYSDSVENQLGQSLAAIALLSAIIKFKGSMILQMQGDGEITTLVAQATDNRKIRGLARGNVHTQSKHFENLFGQGHLVLTIESGHGLPYQGVVSLEGKQLSDVLENYFLQSEQLKTRLWLFANESQAAGLLLQILPDKKDDEAHWQYIEALANTITQQELFELDCQTLLYRLFHEDKIRLFDAESIAFECTCSREKISAALKAMNPTDINSLLEEHGCIETTCEFCNQHYRFTAVDIENDVFVETVTHH